MFCGVRLIGIGSALPSQVIKNQDLESLFETSSDWITERTGIKARRICSPEELQNDPCFNLSLQASKAALTDIDPSSIDLIIVATSTPDYHYPSTACMLQSAFSAPAAAFDLGAACSGFIYALITAAQFLGHGNFKRALVVGADIHSRFLDWNDRSSAILFGDGAGAVVLESCPPQQNELLTYILKSDGTGAKDLYIKTGSTNKPFFAENQALHSPEKSCKVQMNGRKIYQFAVQTLPEVIRRLCSQADMQPEELNYILMHQANQRIIEAVAERLELPLERFPSNLENYGNTSAASIPLVWHEFNARIEEQMKVCLVGFGAGLTVAGALWQKKS